MDITKQNIAEDAYRNLRNNSQPTEKYEGDFKSAHYVNVPNKAISQTITKPSRGYMTEYEARFIDAAKDFWKDVDTAKLTKYMSGEIVCNFNTDSLNIHGYFDRIFQMMRESITMEMSQSGQTTEELKSAFEMVRMSMKVLADQLVKSKKDIDVKALISFMHGFVNIYVKNNIKVK